MRDSLWIPKKERTRPYERPYLKAPSPSPYEHMPYDPSWQRERESEEEDSPRVIIIDI